MLRSWIIISLLTLTLNSATNDLCPEQLVSNCTCSGTSSSSQLNIACHGYDVVHISHLLPENTARFTYVAHEQFVQLGNTNFSRIPTLEALTIKDCGDYNVLVRRIYPTERDDDMFAHLSELRELSINVNWEMERKLPNLFANLTKLEVLDLSNTRLINLDSLFVSFEGLRESLNLTILNLWNIKTMQHSSVNLELNLRKLLEPLSRSKLEVLNLGYNAFRTITPGIIEFAPNLRRLIVRNNVLIPVVTSSLMTEVVLHKSLEEADFSEQGFRPRQESSAMHFHSSTFLYSLNDLFTTVGFKEDEKHSDEKNFITWYNATTIDPIDLIKKYMKCFVLLYDDTCNIFDRACQPVKELLSEKHDLFCALLNLFFRWHFSGVHCSYIPPLEELISADCGACLIIPSSGNIKRMFLANINVYDKVLMFKGYREKPLCFYPHSLLEYFDMSGQKPYGYQDVALTFQHDVNGLENLSFLNLSKAGLEQLYMSITSSFPKLKTIDVSHNSITLAEKKSMHNVTKAIENLDFSHNQISEVQRGTFSNLSALRRLDLSYNRIEKFDADLTSSKNLEYLGLSYNRLDSLLDSVMEQLNNIAFANSSHILHINIGGNNLICTCATKTFVEWVLHTHAPNIKFVDAENYMCSNRYSNRVALQKIGMRNINAECYEPVMYGCTGGGVMLILSLCVITYRRRFFLRHKWYKLTKVVKKRGYGYRHCKYDAFMCFDTSDTDWIDFEVKRHLRGFRIAYGEQCLEFGEHVYEGVCQRIEESYRSILVLSPGFVNSPSKMYEIRLIEEKLVKTGADSVLVINLKPLHRVGLDKTLKDLMERHCCLEWLDGNSDAQSYFWERLKDAIGSPCEELYDTSDESNRTSDESDVNALLT